MCTTHKLILRCPKIGELLSFTEEIEKIKSLRAAVWQSNHRDHALTLGAHTFPLFFQSGFHPGAILPRKIRNRERSAVHWKIPETIWWKKRSKHNCEVEEISNILVFLFSSKFYLFFTFFLLSIIFCIGFRYTAQRLDNHITLQSVPVFPVLKILK